MSNGATIKARIVLDTSEIKQLMGMNVGADSSTQSDSNPDSPKGLLKSLNQGMGFLVQLTKGQFDLAKAGKLAGGILGSTVGSGLALGAGIIGGAALGGVGFGNFLENEFKGGADHTVDTELGVTEEERITQGKDPRGQGTIVGNIDKEGEKVLNSLEELGFVLEDIPSDEIGENFSTLKSDSDDIITTTDGMKIDLTQLSTETKDWLKETVDAQLNMADINQALITYRDTIPRSFKKPRSVEENIFSSGTDPNDESITGLISNIDVLNNRLFGNRNNDETPGDV